MGPTPISNVASNSSAPISVNLLQPGVHACSDCGPVNKSHTAWVEPGKIKRPSIFIYPFIAVALRLCVYTVPICQMPRDVKYPFGISQVFQINNLLRSSLANRHTRTKGRVI